MAKDFITSGFLDVKISAKVKRGLTPWKAWRKQWCEIKRLSTIDHGLEIKFSNSAESNSSNCFIIPRKAILCRTESRSKQYSFGVYAPDQSHKPLLFLSALSESDSQLWMYSIRRMLSFAPHISAWREGYYVSLVDNSHSRAASLNGTHGILTTNALEVTVKDATTSEVRMNLPWHQILQCHLAATNTPRDQAKICVIHTGKDFRSGAGQLYLFCTEAPQLLQLLVARGKFRNSASDHGVSRRFSRSEGDLRDEGSVNLTTSDSPNSPARMRSHTSSDDSGVRLSEASDDSILVLKCKKAASLLSIGLGLLVATPGGSEVDCDSLNELLECEDLTIDNIVTSPLRDSLEVRRDSGVSLVSGVYEEIPDIPSSHYQNAHQKSFHQYEDPIDLILGAPGTPGLRFRPPPLPPRQDTLRKTSISSNADTNADCTVHTPKLKKTHCFTESEYMDMTPSRLRSDSVYMPMTTRVLEESAYMVMSGRKD